MQRSTTKYPKSIRANHIGLFKSGKNNAKLGGNITKGAWKGMPIYSLTLTERDTCPQSCKHWDDCYGNNMPFAHRFKAGAELESAIPSELGKIASKHPKGFVIRLHVLGDFYSPEYVKLWADMLILYPMMRIYGYSARTEGPIHTELWLLNIRFSERAKIRFSEAKEYDSMDPFTIYAGDEKSEFDSIVCPEQLNKTASCATCGLCWGIKKSIKFLSH